MPMDGVDIKPFFTVVIPLYNKQAYVRRSLDSVLLQSFAGFEIVVVDDGSTDNGPGIVSSFADRRIRFIRQPNGGVSVARNRGISEARGDWIAFLDADDEYHPDFLQKVRDAIKRFPTAGAVFARLAWMKGETQVNLPRYRCSETRLLDDYLHFVVFERGYEIHSSSVAIEKAVFARAGAFPEGVRIGEDSDQWLRVAWTARIVHIPEFLATYHMGAGGSNWEQVREEKPYWVGTYRRWLAEARIPKHLLRSSRAFHQNFVLERTLRQVREGQRLAALKGLVLELDAAAAPKSLLAKTMLNLCLPRALVECARRATAPVRHGRSLSRRAT